MTKNSQKVGHLTYCSSSGRRYAREEREEQKSGRKKKKQTNGRAYNEDKGDYPLERGLLIMAKAIIAIILL